MPALSQTQTSALRESSGVMAIDPRVIGRELKAVRRIWLNHRPTTEAASPLLL